ncbi:Mss4-like protein [Irpex lacteus]|nr:Mss4-like protein [Irpex lacteus]
MSSATSEVRYTGTCLCGQIAYEVTGKPEFAGLCHCLNCKKWTGASTGWYVFFKKEHFRLTKGEDTLRTFLDDATDSGTAVHRSFCPSCGSTLAVGITHNDDRVGILAGTVDDDVSGLWKPEFEVYCKDRPKWLPDLGIKQYTASPYAKDK